VTPRPAELIILSVWSRFTIAILVFAWALGSNWDRSIEWLENDTLSMICGLRRRLEDAVILPIVIVAVQKLNHGISWGENVFAPTMGTIAFVVASSGQSKSSGRKMSEATGPATVDASRRCTGADVAYGRSVFT
jgi:hypothetical protein